MTPDCSDCKVTRDALIDDALGQADASTLGAAHTHVERCAECRREVAALHATIARVRDARASEQTALLPTARFRSRLDAALDEVDQRAWSEGRTRLRGAPTLPAYASREPALARWRIAAGVLLTLGLGAALALKLFRDSDDRDNVAKSPDSFRVTPGPRRDADLPAPTPPDLFPKRPGEPTPEGVLPLPPPTEDAIERIRTGAPGELVDLPRSERGDPTLAPLDPPAPSGSDPGRRIGAPDVALQTPVRRALEWLARNQRRDGSFTAGRGEAELDTAVTALALLALVSDGHLGGHLGGDAASERVGALDAAAGRAAAWLFERQDRSDGSFRGGNDRASATFCQATACLALVEHHVRSRAAGRLERGAAARAQDRLEQALSRLEIALAAVIDDDSERCPGQVAAWSALALSTASNGGVDFHLKGTTDGMVARVLKDLSRDAPELMRAASQAILVMAERNPTEPMTTTDPAWTSAIEEVLARPERVEPSLRFLVASALYASRDSAAGNAPRTLRSTRPTRLEEWQAFQSRLAERLQKIQSPESGYFDAAIRWDCFDAGVVYDTALAVLALSVEERHEAWVAARRKVESLR